MNDIKSHSLFSNIKPHIVNNFIIYHDENPKIYELFKKYSYQLKLLGKTYYGVGAIFERIRWHVEVETIGDEFKINNNYRSCYARLLMIEDSNFEGFFQLRKTAGKK